MLIKESFTRDGRLKPGSDQHSPDREARRIYQLARDLINAQGFGNVLRLGNYLTLAMDDDTLTITRDADHRTVLSVVHGDPPFIVSFLGGAWSRLLRREEHRSA